MFLLGYYAIVTAGAVIGGKILSVCLSDDKDTPKNDEDKKQSFSHPDVDYEPFELRSSEWCVLI